MFLTLGGSHAYGTSTPSSDVDVRGVCLNRKSDLLGTSSFDLHEDRQTDTVIYSFNKYYPLIINCNPNAIEMLGCKPDMYFWLSDEGRLLLDNKAVF